MSEWISVEDRFPVLDEECLILLEVKPNIEYGKYIGRGAWKSNWCGRRGEGEDYAVTHWMLLPDPPIDTKTNSDKL